MYSVDVFDASYDSGAFRARPVVRAAARALPAAGTPAGAADAAAAAAAPLPSSVMPTASRSAGASFQIPDGGSLRRALAYCDYLWLLGTAITRPLAHAPCAMHSITSSPVLGTLRFHSSSAASHVA